MKKTVLFFLGVASLYVNAQNNEKLQKNFRDENINNQKKFERYIKNINTKLSETQISEMKSKLAGFAGNIPLFLTGDDTRANASANITPLQNGTFLTGTNITGSGLNILVMDGGRVFDKHREFGADASGIVTNPRIFDKENGNTSYSNHPTNVAGIIGAIGYGNFTTYGNAAAKGVLPNVTIDSYAFTTTTSGTNYQKLEAANANISNHSYGINLGWNYVSSTSTTYPEIGYYWIGNYELNHKDTYNGSYYTQDANFDKIVYKNPNQIVIKSAGNYFGTHPSEDPTKPKFKYDNATDKYVPFADSDELPPANCSQGYNCIGWGSLAKNIIVVGAADQLTTVDNLYTNSTDVVKSDYSSAGPRKDGAIKPDISAVGTNMLIAGYENDTKYNSYYVGSGTSYSAPVISGIAGAITQVNRSITGNSSFTYKADEMKALLIHSANEAGSNPGPDVWYGWGFADAKKAAQIVVDKNNNKVIFERNLLTSGVKFTKEITANGTEPLKATISWVDPAGIPFTSDNDLQNNTSSKLVNDIDLRIIDTTNNTIYYPWKLNAINPMAAATQGDNTVDNVEQVLLNTPVAGRKYRIEISNKGTLVDDGGTASPQNYALIVTGLEASNLAEIAFNNFNIEAKSETCSGKNNGEINISANQSFNYSAKINNGNSLSFTNNKLNIANLAPGNYYVCISVASINYEQCFNITIPKGVTASARIATNSTSNLISVNVEQGTAPFKIFVNGIQKLETTDNNFSIEASQGDLIEVKTALACEGIVSKKIELLLDKATAYPNPAKDFVYITIPSSEKEVEIELYAADGKLASKQLYTVSNGEAKVDVSKLNDGIYIAKVSLKNPVNIKIIKKQ